MEYLHVAMYVCMLNTHDVLRLECDVKTVVGTKPKLYAI